MCVRPACLVVCISYTAGIAYCHPNVGNGMLQCRVDGFAAQQHCTTTSTEKWLQCTRNAAVEQRQCISNTVARLKRCNLDVDGHQQRCAFSPNLDCRTSLATMRSQCRSAAASTQLQCGSMAGAMQVQCSSMAVATQTNCTKSAVEKQQQCGSNYSTTLLSVPAIAFSVKPMSPRSQEKSMSDGTSLRIQAIPQSSSGEGDGTPDRRFAFNVASERGGTASFVEKEVRTGTLLVKAGLVHSLGAAVYAFISLLTMVARIREEIPFAWKVVLDLSDEFVKKKGWLSATGVAELFTKESLSAVMQAIGVEWRHGPQSRAHPFERSWDICIGRRLHLKPWLKKWNADLNGARATWRHELDKILKRGDHKTPPTPCVTVRGMSDFFNLTGREGDVFSKFLNCSRVQVSLLDHFFRRSPSWVSDVVRYKKNGKLTLQISVLGYTGSTIFHHSLFERGLASRVLRLLRVRPNPQKDAEWPWQIRQCAYYFKREGNHRSPEDTISLMQAFIAKYTISCVYVNSLDEPSLWDAVSLSNLQVTHAQKQRWTNEQEFFFATVSPLFIVDQSSHWGDYILSYRSLQDMPSVILPWLGEGYAALECDFVNCAKCMFRRSWCFNFTTMLDIETAWDGCEGYFQGSVQQPPKHPIDWP